MRIAVLGLATPLARAVLDAASSHQAVRAISAVIVAETSATLRATLRRAAARLPGQSRRDALAAQARALDARIVRLRGDGGAADQSALAAIDADLLLVAGCPFLVHDDVLARFRLGGVNAHPALLPRHRGASPYFWLYWHGDSDTGLTAHAMVRRADAGAVLAQARVAVPRGWPVNVCGDAIAALAGDVTHRALDRIAAGLPGTAQDETLATRAPHVRPDTAYVPFAEWDVTRVWHFLHGLDGRYREPLADRGGRPLRYAGVGAYDAAMPDQPPGTVRVEGGVGRLACRDGWITLFGVETA